MRIIATFVNFKDAPDAIELVHAWDEYAVDNNFDGYRTSLEEELAAYGNGVLHSVEAYIEVPLEEIRERLCDPVVVTASQVTLAPEPHHCGDPTCTDEHGDEDQRAQT